MTALKKTKNKKAKARSKPDVTPLLIILMSVILVFLFSRLIAYLVINGLLPQALFVDVGGFRLHHFVYGNIIIITTSFLAIGLGLRKHKNLFALCYGIGLGLVLDEFLLWMGDVNELTRKTVWIPYSLTVIAVVSLVITSIIMIDLYKIKLSKLSANGKKNKKS